MDDPIPRFTHELATLAEGSITEAQAKDFVQRVYGVGRNEGGRESAADVTKFQRQAEELRRENTTLRNRLGLPPRKH
ncbi:hypothetical protein ACEZCY_25245 [Streptacidiphilus sp. N1-12]|uniref:Uncharacterized protein n=2 Tax=Streptacidiphilus alkalitolerans TaxID=3342712 RepID=A0ABV6V760_9ACTN